MPTDLVFVLFQEALNVIPNVASEVPNAKESVTTAFVSVKVSANSHDETTTQRLTDAMVNCETLAIALNLRQQQWEQTTYLLAAMRAFDPLQSGGGFFFALGGRCWSRPHRLIRSSQNEPSEASRLSL